MTSSLTLCEIRPPADPRIESYSPFCLKVRRALNVTRLPFTSRHADAPAAFKKLNPAGQVPILLIGDEVVVDSTRIVERLVRLAPGRLDSALDERQRAEAALWEELADTSLNGFLVAARWADERNWGKVKVAYFSGMPAIVRAVLVPRIRARVVRTLYARDVLRHGLPACWGRFETLLGQLELLAPRAGYWVGTALSSADLAIFAQLQSLRTELTPWQGEQVEGHPTLRAYLDRIDEETRAIPVSTRT